jgi:hypothetical protein
MPLLSPTLAKELRTFIWDTFLEIPQVVDVRLVTVEYTGKRLAVPIGQHPVLRQVNKESRHEAKTFQIWGISNTQATCISAPKIFFNPHIDTLRLANVRVDDVRFGHQYDIFCEPLRIENLALPAEIFLHDLNYLKANEVFDILLTLCDHRKSLLLLEIIIDSNVKFISPRGGSLEYFADMWVGGSIRKLEARNSICEWEHRVESFTKKFGGVLQWQRTERGILKGIDDHLLFNELQKYTPTYLPAQTKSLLKTILRRRGSFASMSMKYEVSPPFVLWKPLWHLNSRNRLASESSLGNMERLGRADNLWRDKEVLRRCLLGSIPQASIHGISPPSVGRKCIRMCRSFIEGRILGGSLLD